MKSKNRLFYIFIFFVGIFLFFACQERYGPGMSNTISESKKLGVFICEYKTPYNPYKINDSISLTVKRAWVEKKFYYEGYTSIRIIDGYHLTIEVESKYIKGYPSLWTIGTTTEHNIRSCGIDCLMQDLPSNFNFPNNFFWQVQKGWLRNSVQPTIIGKFELVKK